MENIPQKGKVYLIGAGPGDPDLLTLKAVKALKESDVVLYDHLVGEKILRFCRDDAKLVFVGKSDGFHTLPQEEINRLIGEYAKNGTVVTRLKGGDPFVFGRGGEEYASLAALGYRCEVIPGITAAVGAAASAALPLTHRDYASGVMFITGHRKGDGNYEQYKNLNLKDHTHVIYMGVHMIEELSNIICLASEENREVPAAVIQNATLEDQRIFTGTVGTIADITKKNGVTPPAIFILGDVVRCLPED